MNKVILIGRLGADPEVKQVGGQSVCRLRVATSRRVRRGDDWLDETTWHTVVVWGAQADACARHLSRGRELAIEGRIDVRVVGDGDARRTYVDVVADHVRFLGGRGEGGGGGGGRPAPAPSTDLPPGDGDGDDIPF